MWNWDSFLSRLTKIRFLPSLFHFLPNLFHFQYHLLAQFEGSKLYDDGNSELCAIFARQFVSLYLCEHACSILSDLITYSVPPKDFVPRTEPYSEEEQWSLYQKEFTAYQNQRKKKRKLNQEKRKRKKSEYSFIVTCSHQTAVDKPYNLSFLK